MSKQDGLYCLAKTYYKVVDGNITTIDGNNVKDTTVVKRMRRAKNEDGLLDFVIQDECQAEFLSINYIKNKEVESSYASFNWCNENMVNVDLYDRRVVHKECTTYKISTYDVSIWWKDIDSIQTIREIPSWTPESTPDCSSCGSASEVEADE